MWSMQRISRLRLLLVAPASFLLLVAAGCLIVPIPDKGPDPLPDAALQFLEADGTTRDDVLDQLGEPAWRFDEYRVFVYERYRYLGKLFWGYFVPVGSGAADAGTLPMREHIALYVAFDAYGEVVAHSFPKQPLVYSLAFKSIRGRVEKWAKKEHLERIDLEFVVPPGRSGVVFYRPGGFWEPPDLHASILIDGVRIAEMQGGTYLPIVVEPGDHDVQVVPINPVPEPVSKRPSIETSIATGPDETVYLWLKLERSKKSGAKLERRPESKAMEKLAGLELISPPAAYAGW